MEQSRQILTLGKELLDAEITLHGEELSQMGSAEMAAEINARSISHCEFISGQGIKAIAESRTVAIICPTTAYLLRLEPPPVREMIEQNVIVAIGSDFNPNAYCFSLMMAMNLAVISCRMSMNEALVATTINAAYALKKSASHGSLQVGKVADMILLDCSDWRNIIYQMGHPHHLIRAVVKRGHIVFPNN